VSESHPVDDPQPSKAASRRWARSLPPVTSGENASLLVHLGEWLSAWPPGTVALTYMAMPGEIDLEHLTRALVDLEWVTTRTPEVGDLTIHPYDAPKEVHFLGFHQPTAGSTEIDPDRIAVALVPGLAFDGCGHRLGRGKGYYDRLLEKMPRATLVGVTLDRRLLARLPFEDHDVTMHRLATESGCIWVEPCV